MGETFFDFTSTRRVKGLTRYVEVLRSTFYKFLPLTHCIKVPRSPSKSKLQEPKCGEFGANLAPLRRAARARRFLRFTANFAISPRRQKFSKNAKKSPDWRFSPLRRNRGEMAKFAIKRKKSPFRQNRQKVARLAIFRRENRRAHGAAPNWLQILRIFALEVLTSRDFEGL